MGRKYFQKILLVFSILVYMILCVGCGFSANYDGDSFIEDMESMGCKITVANESIVKNTILGVYPDYFTLNNELIALYRYNTTEELEKNIKGLSEDGTQFKLDKTNMTLVWEDEPHFYKKGILVVQYIGSNTETLQFLDKVFGKQFAGSN